MTTRDMYLALRAFGDVNYGQQQFLLGKQRGTITWESKLGEFMAYSGLAYHIKNRGIDQKEKALAWRAFQGLWAVREGLRGHPKAITLYDLKQVIEGPLGEIYPKGWGRGTEQYLNSLLSQHGLEPIISRKRWNRHAMVRSKLTAKLEDS